MVKGVGCSRRSGSSVCRHEAGLNILKKDEGDATSERLQRKTNERFVSACIISRMKSAALYADQIYLFCHAQINKLILCDEDVECVIIYDVG